MRPLLMVAMGVFFLAVAPGAAQGPGGPLYRVEIDKDADGSPKVFSSFLEGPGKRGLYVRVQFKVLREGDGSVATDVSKDEITVEEDGRRVEDLEITQPTVQKLTTVLAVDTSGSMERNHKMDEARQAARTFLDMLDAKADTGLILFDHRMRVLEEPTRDPAGFAAHRARVRGLIDQARPGGGTAYIDATHEAVRMLKPLDGRRAVILMTDGVDMNSKRNLETVIQDAKTAEIPVYTLGVGQPGKNEQVTTVLVLDHSGSMAATASDDDNEPKIKALHRAAARFVDLMRPGAQTTLLPFSTTVDLPQPFSTDKEGLKRSIARLKPEGGTLLYDATYEGIETLMAARPPGKRAVVVLTDGKDEAPGSRHSDRLVIERAREAKVPLYMLGLGRKNEINEAVMRRMARETGGAYYHAENAQRLIDIFENLSIQLHDDGIDEASLRRLAKETGGEYFPVHDVSKLRLAYERLATELQSTYTVTYRSPRSVHDGTARRIVIGVVRNGVRVGASDVADYNERGVVFAHLDLPVYLVSLSLLAGLLLFPAGLRRLHKLYGGAGARG